MRTTFFRLAARLAAIFRHRSDDADFAAELESHIDLLQADLERRGMTPDAARRSARLRLGGAAQLQEAHRAARGLPLVETVVRDVRIGLRALARSPGFSAAALMTLAIGIGANTAIFSVLHGVLLKPLPYGD